MTIRRVLSKPIYLVKHPQPPISPGGLQELSKLLLLIPDRFYEQKIGRNEATDLEKKTASIDRCRNGLTWI